MKKFTKIIAAAMAAATIAVTTSVCASAIKLTTGEALTEEVVDRYADIMKACNMSCDSMFMFTDQLGFWYPHKVDILAARDKNEHEFAYIDEWATHQKRKVRQEREGYSYWNRFSRG